jgi:hypothetical protein
MDMNKRLSIALALLLACTIFSAGSARSQGDGVRELGRPEDVAALGEVLEKLEDILAQLSYADELSGSEVQELRRELGQIYRELDMLHAGRDGNPEPLPEAPAGWELYTKRSISLTPTSASFSGWRSGYRQELSFGQSEDIYVKINNGYSAECRLLDAYQGSVNVSSSIDDNGAITLEVEDELGTHYFRIDNGGLGPVYAKGWPPGKQTSPLDPATYPPGKWDSAYKAALHGGELEGSAAFDWFALQVKNRSYASDELRELGEYLRGIEGELGHERIAVLRFYRNGADKSYPFPDPRLDPAGFLDTLKRVYALDSADDWYEIELD